MSQGKEHAISLQVLFQGCFLGNPSTINLCTYEREWAHESTEIFPAGLSAPLAESSPDCTPGNALAFGRACPGPVTLH